MICEQEFNERYKPCDMVYTLEDIQNRFGKSVGVNHIWTVVADQETNNHYALTGIQNDQHILGYVHTDKAWTDETDDAIYYDAEGGYDGGYEDYSGLSEYSEDEIDY